MTCSYHLIVGSQTGAGSGVNSLGSRIGAGSGADSVGLQNGTGSWSRLSGLTEQSRLWSGLCGLTDRSGFWNSLQAVKGGKPSSCFSSVYESGMLHPRRPPQGVLPFTPTSAEGPPRCVSTRYTPRMNVRFWVWLTRSLDPL